MKIKDKIFVAGHKGLVGSAILKTLKSKGYKNIITASKKELNLVNQKKVFSFLKKHRPKFIFLAAAKVGGIYSNNLYKADYIYENLMIQTNVINSAFKTKTKNLIFLASSCAYPKFTKQPIKEKYILAGKLEETNDAFAVAKLAGIKMCESYNKQYKTNYKCLMSSNVFGPNDNYDSLNSHFFGSLIKKIYDIEKNHKKKIVVWGDGTPKREILYADDLADACIFFMKKKVKEDLINIGSGKDKSIEEYVKFFLKTLLPKKKIKIVFNKSKPNGTSRKLMDISLAKKYGWTPKISLKESIIKTYSSYCLSQNKKLSK